MRVSQADDRGIHVQESSLSLSLSLSLLSLCLFSVGSVGFEPENVTVTEGVDNFALVNVRFFNADVSSDVFTQLSVFTMDGTALGPYTIATSLKQMNFVPMSLQ